MDNRIKIKRDFQKIVDGLELLGRYDSKKKLVYFGIQQGYQIGKAVIPALSSPNYSVERGIAFVEEEIRDCETGKIRYANDPEAFHFPVEEERVLKAISSSLREGDECHLKKFGSLLEMTLTKR